MWVRTQDGKTTIKVDRFTVEEKHTGEYCDVLTFRFQDHIELQEFKDANPLAQIVSVQEDVREYSDFYTGYSRLIHYVLKCKMPVIKFCITCGDVVLGTYSSLEKAEKVRDDYLENWIRNGGPMIFMPKDEEVD